MSNSLTQVSTQPLVENFATLTYSSSTKDDPWGWLVSISTHQPTPVLTPARGEVMKIGRELAPGGELFDQDVKEYEEEAVIKRCT